MSDDTKPSGKVYRNVCGVPIDAVLTDVLFTLHQRVYILLCERFPKKVRYDELSRMTGASLRETRRACSHLADLNLAKRVGSATGDGGAVAMPHLLPDVDAEQLRQFQGINQSPNVQYAPLKRKLEGKEERAASENALKWLTCPVTEREVRHLQSIGALSGEPEVLKLWGTWHLKFKDGGIARHLEGKVGSMEPHQAAVVLAVQSLCYMDRSSFTKGFIPWAQWVAKNWSESKLLDRLDEVNWYERASLPPMKDYFPADVVTVTRQPPESCKNQVLSDRIKEGLAKSKPELDGSHDPPEKLFN